MKLGVNERLRGKRLYVEVWKPIVTDKEDYTGLYEVSNLGRVRSLNYKGEEGRVKVLRSNKDNIGYLCVSLYKNGKIKTHRVHRLVAMAFIPNPENKPHVDHINTVKTKNIWTNLRWVTKKENANNPLSCKHNSEAKKKGWRLNDGYIEGVCKKVICLETGKVFNSIKEAGEIMGVYSTNISKCCTGKQKTSGGFHWAYYEEEVNE